MKAALVYDRVNKWGGAERVLLALHEIFPDAALYTAVHSPEKAGWAKVFPKVIPSFLQKIPVLNKYHELLGTFAPLAFETFDFSGYDLIISVTSEAGKGIIIKPHTKHICYCLTPTRYLWSGYEEYTNNPPKLLRTIPFYGQLSKPLLNYVRKWDLIAAHRPDAMVAISSDVQKRIKKYYGRESEIIFPPVDVERFITAFKKTPGIKPEDELNAGMASSFRGNPAFKGGEDVIKMDATRRHRGVEKEREYYLIVSRLVPYKKVDLAIQTFNDLGYPLVVIGAGSEEGKLKSLAKENVEFKGFVSDEELVNYYKFAKALIHPQDEDFGITPVEAQAAGVPVIAYEAGGALDTIIDGKTGIFFSNQTKKSLADAIGKFEKKRFNKDGMEENARRFSKDKFIDRFDELVSKIAE